VLRIAYRKIKNPFHLKGERDFRGTTLLEVRWLGD